MTDEQRIVLFKRRLAETVAWCASRADILFPETSLRTEILRPTNRIIDANGNLFPYHWQFEVEEDQAIRVLAAERARLLDSRAIPMPDLPEALTGGRLLVAEPMDSIPDGNPELWSEGFFDIMEVPPWDTWIGIFPVPPDTPRNYGLRCLLCWVPPVFVELANKGIWGNALGCISWATDQVDHYPLLREVERAGLLV